MTGNRDARPLILTNSRWALLALAVFMFVLLGLYYSWSIFMGPLEKEFGWTRSQTSTPFAICLPAFCLGSMVAGALSRVWPHQYSICLGAAMLGCGLFIASGAYSLPRLYFGYGVLVGGGIGMAYTSLLSTMLPWFSDRLGLASGLLLTGYGFGGMLISAMGTGLIGLYGWRFTMLALACAISSLVFIGAFFIAPPREGTEFPEPGPGTRAPVEDSLDLPPGQMIRRSSFYIYFGWILLIYSCGLMLMGHAVPLAEEQGADAETAAFVAGLIAICNGFGRLLSGILLDRFGRRPVMVGICCGLILAALILFMALRAHSLLLVSAAYIVAGLVYGASTSCNAAIIRLFYGMRHFAMNFSVVNFNLIFAALLGPHLAGVLHVQTGSYLAITPILAAFSGMALVLALRLKRP